MLPGEAFGVVSSASALAAPRKSLADDPTVPLGLSSPTSCSTSSRCKFSNHWRSQVGSTAPAAISRSAVTVGLSQSSDTCGVWPRLNARARAAASSTSSKRFGTTRSQSMVVIRAIRSPMRPDGPRCLLLGRRQEGYRLVVPDPRRPHRCCDPAARSGHDPDRGGHDLGHGR